jgi:DNA-binding response OmpR family regulator
MKEEGQDMRSMWYHFRERTGGLRRRWGQFSWKSTTVLAVTNNFNCRMSLRVLSLEQGWRILFAESLEDGLRLQRMNRAGILVYDLKLPDVEWRRGLRVLTKQESVFPIVISDVLNSRLRSEVLACGGYDVARNPLEPQRFVALVNGALGLAKSIDSLQLERD